MFTSLIPCTLLSSVFDTINHNILFIRLADICISHNTHKIIIIIIRFRQCRGDYRSGVTYRDNYPFINTISFIIDKTAYDGL